MDFFDQCTALITGASSGLGEEFARQLAPRASTLILIARRADRLETLACELRRPGLTIHTRKVDLSSREEVEALIDWLAQERFPISFLVNNAGLGDYGHFIRSDWERVRQMLEVNIAALTRLSYALLPTLRVHPEAAILNVASIAGLIPMPKMAVYAATKAYVISFSEALRAELRWTTVRVTALCPGPSPTEFGSTAERELTGDTMPSPELFKVPPQQIVSEGLRAVDRDRARVIPGWVVALVMLVTAAMPLCLLRAVMRNNAR
ncbi:MAG TPA: SDR family oxidoreductase [Chthoniobacteraceae bacterium]|nr:SDR family oxidoreductase [Chthoniobacteraceae bacterium]